MGATPDHALEQGAFGMSTGLTHVPSAYGDFGEVAALASLCLKHGALYATHCRRSPRRTGRGRRGDRGRAADRGDGRVQPPRHQPTRRWGHGAELLAMFEAARDDGVDICFDVYPYDASSSSLTQYLPHGCRPAAPRRWSTASPFRRCAAAPSTTWREVVRRHPVAVGPVPREQLPRRLRSRQDVGRPGRRRGRRPVEPPSGCASATATSCRSCSSTASRKTSRCSCNILGGDRVRRQRDPPRPADGVPAPRLRHVPARPRAVRTGACCTRVARCSAQDDRRAGAAARPHRSRGVDRRCCRRHRVVRPGDRDRQRGLRRASAGADRNRHRHRGRDRGAGRRVVAQERQVGSCVGRAERLGTIGSCVSLNSASIRSNTFAPVAASLDLPRRRARRGRGWCEGTPGRRRPTPGSSRRSGRSGRRARAARALRPQPDGHHHGRGVRDPRRADARCAGRAVRGMRCCGAPRRRRLRPCDADGEILERVRRLVGHDVVIGSRSTSMPTSRRACWSAPTSSTSI